MKNLALAMGVLWSVVFFSSCAQKGPEEVVKKFYTHLCKGEFDKIQDCVSDEHYSYWGYYNVSQTAEEKKKKSEEKIEISDVRCTIMGAEATCSCLLKIGDEPFQKEVIKLKKVGNKWLVDQGEEEEYFIPAQEELQIMEMNQDDDDYEYRNDVAED